MLNEKAFVELERSIKNFEDIKRSGFTKQIEYDGDNPLWRMESELNKIRDNFEKYRADQAAYQAAAELREKKAEKRGFWKGVLSSLIIAILANLFIYYWPSVVALFPH